MNATTLPANSFTFLRLMLAMLVVLGHSCVLGGFGEEPLGRWSGGTATGRELAVQGFFILSGFLLAASLAREPSLARFAGRRAFRILPGYWAALLVTSFIVIPAMFARNFPGQMGYAQSLAYGDQNAMRYLEVNALLWQGQRWIRPFFLQNPSSGIVNGSMWSLFYEVLCYAFLACGAWLGQRGLIRRRVAAFAIFTLLYGACVFHAFMPMPRLEVDCAWKEIVALAIHPDGPRVVLAFTAGVAAFGILRGRPAWNARWFAIASAVFAISVPLGATPLVWPVALPYLLLCLGERLPFSRLEKVGDISYGIYIYSFLIQQCLYAAGCHRLGFWTFSGVSLGLSIIAGTLSWLLVEQPFIRLGQQLTARWKIGTALKPLPINSASDQMLSAASHRAG